MDLNCSQPYNTMGFAVGTTSPCRRFSTRFFSSQSAKPRSLFGCSEKALEMDVLPAHVSVIG